MAITHVASAAGATSNPTLSDQVTLSALIQAGDILLVWVHARYGDASIPLDTVTDNDTGGNAWAQKGISANNRLSLWWKIATANTASKTVTATLASSGAILMGYSAYRSDGSGFDSDSITNLSFENNASGNETHAGFTPAAADSLIGLAVAPMNDVTVSSQSTTSPGALTERFDKISSAAQDHGLSFASALQSGGPTATGNFTWAQTNVESDSAVHALRTAAAGGTLHEATATTSITISSTGTGHAGRKATAATTVTVTGSATAHAVRKATAATQVTVTSTATGKSQPQRATATTVITVTGAGTAKKTGRRTATTSVGVTSTGTGKARRKATATTTITITSVGSGERVVPPKQATATTVITVTAQGSGKAVRKATATTQISITTTAKGWVPKPHFTGYGLLDIADTRGFLDT